MAAALDNNGRISVTGNTTPGTTKQATLNIGSAAGFGTPGVLSGIVTLTGDALIEFASGQITSIASISSLTLNGAQARVADTGNLSTNSALTGLTSVMGSFSLEDGVVFTTGAGLSLGSPTNDDSYLNVDGVADVGGSHLTINGTLTNTTRRNQGFGISIGNNSMSASCGITASRLISDGDIGIRGGRTPGTTIQATLNITAAAGFGTAGLLTGSADLSGDALIEFASGQITGIVAGAFLRLDGVQSRVADAGNLATNSALTGLANNAGGFYLRNGAAVAVSGALDNSFQLFVDGGSSLTVAGTLTNSGNLSQFLIGRPFDLNSTRVTVDGLANTGSLEIAGSFDAHAILHVTHLTTGSGGSFSLRGNATAALDGAVAAGQTIDFFGGGNRLELGTPGSFGGAITDFAPGETLDLRGETLTGLSYSGSTLTVTPSAGGSQSFSLAGAFTGLAAQSDGADGSDIVGIAGTYELTTGTDLVTLLSSTNTIFGTAATLNASDNLIGGPDTDTLALTGGGTFSLATLAGFSGFEAVTLDNTGSALSLRADTNPTVTAGTGNDTLIAGTGAFAAASRINGGGGIDALTLSGDYSAGVTFGATTLVNVEQINLGAGHNYSLTTNDATVASGQTLTVNAAALAAANTLTFNGAAETNGRFNITGGAGADHLTGGAGADALSGGGGADTMTGGADNDTYIVDNAGDRVIEASSGGTDKVATSVSYALSVGQSIESLTPVSFGSTTALSLTGNTLAQAISGNAGNNIISDGGAGGVDTLSGLGGNDTYIVNNSGDAVMEAAGGGTDRVAASVSYTLGSGQSIESLTPVSFGSTTNINLTGNALAQAITGNAGNNIISDGGAGAADTMSGLGGDDTYVVNNAGDKVTEAANGGTDRVNASVSYVLTAGQSIEKLATESFTGTTNINLTGNTLAQAIIGNAGNNVLNDGGAGAADTLSGLGGNDIYVVNNTADTVVEAANGGTDRVASSGSYALGAGQSIETLAPTSYSTTTNLAFDGNALAQAIIGNAGNNVIDGKGGNDALTGMGGNDTFRFDTTPSTSTNDPTVTDFTVGADMIELSQAIYTAIPIGPLSQAAFFIGSAAHDASDRVIYNSGTGALLYDFDGTGGGASVQFAKLSAGLAMTAGQFHVG